LDSGAAKKAAASSQKRERKKPIRFPKRWDRVFLHGGGNCCWGIKCSWQDCQRGRGASGRGSRGGESSTFFGKWRGGSGITEGKDSLRRRQRTFGKEASFVHKGARTKEKKTVFSLTRNQKGGNGKRNDSIY